MLLYTCRLIGCLDKTVHAPTSAGPCVVFVTMFVSRLFSAPSKAVFICHFTPLIKDVVVTGLSIQVLQCQYLLAPQNMHTWWKISFMTPKRLLSLKFHTHIIFFKLFLLISRSHILLTSTQFRHDIRHIVLSNSLPSISVQRPSPRIMSIATPQSICLPWPNIHAHACLMSMHRRLLCSHSHSFKH